MRYIFVSALFISASAFAQSFLEDIQHINQKIGESEVDSYVSRPTEDGVPGQFMSSLMPASSPTTEPDCDEKKESNTRYEVIMVAEVNSKLSKLQKLPDGYRYFYTEDLQVLNQIVPVTFSSTGLTKDAVLQRAQDIWGSPWVYQSTTLDPNNPVGKTLVMEAIFQAASHSSLNEKELSRSVAGVIAEIYTTDEEKYEALRNFSIRLYRNYNMSRNPSYNNKTNNPLNNDIPEGDINLSNIMKAAAEFNEFQGGVCNDISEAVILVGEHLFPNKDLLAVNSGSHFGVMVADGKETRIIDGGYAYKMNNRLLLNPSMASSNLRISKMDNGALKEIAVVDTEVGQVVESAFQTGKKLLKTDADISTMMAHLKKENFGVSIGTAELSDSDMLIIVAKYENAGDKWSGYAGGGLSAQDFNMDFESRYSIHFRAGAERNLFHYVNNQTEVNFSSGGRLNGMWVTNQPSQMGGGARRVDTSLGLDFYNRLDVNYGKHNPDGVQLRSSVEVEHTLGPSNWGNTTGALSELDSSDVGTVLKNTRFHLNQVNAELNLEKKLSNTVTGVGNTTYQGSNIGQGLSVLAGLKIDAPQGAQILVFTGKRNNDMGGYETKHSYLGNPSGTFAGAKYRSQSGIEVGATVRDNEGEKSFEAEVKVPLGGSKKKRTISGSSAR